MQRLTWKCVHHFGQGCGKSGGLGEKGAAIVAIANYGMADMRHMNPDLVGSTGLQPAFDQARHRFAAVAKPLLHRKMRHRMAGIDAVGRHDSAPRAVAGTAQRRINCAAHAPWCAPDQRIIGPFEIAIAAMIGEAFRQRVMRPVGLGDDEHSACILVEPVDDSRPPGATNARKC